MRRWRSISASTGRCGSAPARRRPAGRRKSAILGDVCEAVLAALYLEAGLERVRPLVETHWGPRMRAFARRCAMRRRCCRNGPRGAPADPGLSRDRPVRTGPCAGVPGYGEARRHRARARAPDVRNVRRSRMRRRYLEARGTRVGGRPWRLKNSNRRDARRGRHRAAASSRSSARRTRASRRCSITWSGPRSRSSPQGADDARTGAWHRHRRAVAGRLRRYAGHLQAAPPARPRHGDDRMGARQGRRSRRRSSSTPSAASTTRSRRSSRT